MTWGGSKEEEGDQFLSNSEVLMNAQMQSPSRVSGLLAKGTHKKVCVLQYSSVRYATMARLSPRLTVSSSGK